MTEADREIVQILKELFRSKKNELVDPDDLLQEKIVKSIISSALFCIIALAPIKVLGSIESTKVDGFLSGVIGVAFTVLFIHLNIKSKNPSFILYVLTWLSLMVSLWLAS
jgi:lipopolysaccharide export LptBFGC system permease protein LptF